MSNKLEPCPFCKSKGAIRSKQSAGTMYVNWAVGCSNLKCVASSGLLVFRYDTREEAIDAWNQRDERTCKIIEDPYRPIFKCCSNCYGHMEGNEDYCPKCESKVVE